MKVAFVLSTCIRSGPFIVAANIINNIAGEVEPIDIYYIKEGYPQLEMNGQKIKVDRFGRTNFAQYDIVHSHGFLGDVHCFLNRKTIKGKWITTLHQKIRPVYSLDYNKVIGTVLEFVWLRMVARCAAVVCLTQDMANYYLGKRALGRTKVTYVHNGITPVPNPNFRPASEELAALESLKSNYKVLGVSANVTYLKGIDRVLELMKLDSANDVALLVLGEGPFKESLMSMARENGIADRVLFVGFKPNPIDYFKYFDVYMMSSRSEGFGLCVIEAASQSIPVVCSDLPVFHELFPGDVVVRFDLQDAHAMLTAVRTALANHQKLGSRLHELYLKKFSASAMAKGYLDVYKEVRTR